MVNRKALPTIVIALVSFGFVEGIMLLFYSAPRNGLELIGVIPIVWSICTLAAFSKLIEYQAGGVGLKIFYAVSIVRYLIHPLLVSISEGEIDKFRMSSVSAQSYTFSIVIFCLELILATIFILRCYPKQLSKAEYVSTKISYDRPLGGTFLLWMLLIIAYLAMRAPIWMPQLNIFGLKNSSNSQIILVEAMCINCVKAFMFTICFDKVLSLYRKGQNYKTMLIITIIAALANILTYFGSNRSFVVETAIVTIALLCFEMPEWKHLIAIATIPLSVILIVSMFISKQYSAASLGEISDGFLTIRSISNTLEEYVNGLWVVAQDYDLSLNLDFITRFNALQKNLTDGCLYLLDLPFLRWIREFTVDYNSTTDLFRFAINGTGVNRGQIPSFTADIFVVFGEFGWFVFPICEYIAINLLCKYEARSKHFGQTWYKYIYLWLSVLFGLTYCYNFQILLYCCTKFSIIYCFICSSY